MPITENAIRFLNENHRINDREWFVAHREQYRELVEKPMLDIARALGPLISDIDPAMETRPRRTLSRIWRDVRFSKDKSLFKKSVWITFHREKGLSHPVYFFEFCGDFHRYGCGYYATPPVVMARIRQEVLAGGKLFRAAQAAMGSLPGFGIEGECYKRPKYQNQPEELREWLERRSVTALYTSQNRSGLFAGNLPEVLADAFIKLAPVYKFMTHCHVEAMKENEFRSFVKGSLSSASEL